VLLSVLDFLTVDDSSMSLCRISTNFSAQEPIQILAPNKHFGITKFAHGALCYFN
jgi:hypothetical protein